MDFEKVKEIIVDSLSCDESQVTMEANLKDDLEADSLDAVELIMQIEEEFEELAKLYEVSTLHPFYCLSMAE